MNTAVRIGRNVAVFDPVRSTMLSVARQRTLTRAKHHRQREITCVEVRVAHEQVAEHRAVSIDSHAATADEYHDAEAVSSNALVEAVVALGHLARMARHCVVRRAAAEAHGGCHEEHGEADDVVPVRGCTLMQWENACDLREAWAERQVINARAMQQVAPRETPEHIGDMQDQQRERSN